MTQIPFEDDNPAAGIPTREPNLEVLQDGVPFKKDKELHEMTLSEAIAEAANLDKQGMAVSLINAFKKGEPSAIKAVTQALIEHQYSEENSFPIPDARFKELILVIAGAISKGEI